VVPARRPPAELTARYETSGLPQGTAVSPLLSNLYLDAFDRAMLEGGHHLVPFSEPSVGASLARHDPRS
jgi:CRISPR-associated protein Cas1